MSETEFGRKPVEIIEILLPNCANTHGSAPCTATQTGDGKCFNTRATCNDVDNFQARPLAHLTADLLLEDNETGAQTENGSNNYIMEVEFRMGSAPEGVLFEIGGGTDNLYAGFNESNMLVVRCGDSSVATGANVARLVLDVSADFGKTLNLIVVASRDPSTNQTVTAYFFDPVELELTLLGTATSSGDSGAIFGSGDYGVGEEGGTVPVDESSADFNGSITTARLFTDQTATLTPGAGAYRQRYLFDDGRVGKPAGGEYILPFLLSASTVGTKINLTGSDDRYEPLGRRAYMDLQFYDAPHSDHRVDPYRTDRSYDPLARSTFWKKWIQRHKFGRTRALVRRYTGYDGQLLSEMERQSYVLDRVVMNGERVSMKCRDVLSLTEFRRAQVPAPSPGKLDAAITSSDTSLTLTGDQTNAYPASGTLRIADELMTYSGISYDSGSDATTFSSLTRGTDGSTAEDHDEGNGVQICRRYTNIRVAPLLEELILDDAKVPAQLADLEKIQTEDDENLDAYTLTTLISEPTGVDRLVGEVAEQCCFYVWWNERSQKIDMQAIKPLSGVDRNLTQEDHIVGGSFRVDERPKERITTLSIYYLPRDFAGDLSKPVNYENQLIVARADADNPDQFGKLPQIREIYSRWLESEAQANQTGSRIANRYSEIVNYVSFLVDAKDRQIWTGDFVTISHDDLVDARGNRVGQSRRWLVVEAEEAEAGHSQRLTCVDVTLDGQVYVITENGIGTYTPELFGEGNAFITDNSGLNPDGSVGATIA